MLDPVTRCVRNASDIGHSARRRRRRQCGVLAELHLALPSGFVASADACRAHAPHAAFRPAPNTRSGINCAIRSCPGGTALIANAPRRRFSSAVEQRFCKPKVGSSILSTGTAGSHEERRDCHEFPKASGIDPSALTADEATCLLNFRDADAILSRVAAAARARGERLGAKGVPRELNFVPPTRPARANFSIQSLNDNARGQTPGE